MENELQLSKLLMARATDLLSMGIGENDRMKDAPMLARAASKLSRKALNLDGLDGHVAAVIRAGFEVTDPTLLMIELDKIEGQKMIKLKQSIPIITSEEREAFSHDQTAFNALQLLRSYGFKISYEGVVCAIRLGKSGKIQTLKCKPSRKSEPVQGEDRP